MTEIKTLVGSSVNEQQSKIDLAVRLRSSAIPNAELLDNLGVYMTRQSMSRVLFMHGIYQQILPVHGVVMEFGVRWGQNLSLFSNFRGIHEPYNYTRKLIGFDTFDGFPSVAAEDGSAVAVGDYAVVPGWEVEVESILGFHEKNAPIPHKRKFELVKGDATVTLPAYLARHPETIIALAYFDFDLYQPTKDCLEAILPHVTQGTVLAFDELNCADLPGETLAVREVLGLSNHAIRRDSSSPLTSYIVL